MGPGGSGWVTTLEKGSTLEKPPCASVCPASALRTPGLSVSSPAARPDDHDLVRHHENNCSSGFMLGWRDWKGQGFI